MLFIAVLPSLINQNARDGTNKPPLRIYKSRGDLTPLEAHAVEITGPSRIVYEPFTPLNCGARVWVETEAAIVIEDRNG